MLSQRMPSRGRRKKRIVYFENLSSVESSRIRTDPSRFSRWYSRSSRDCIDINSRQHEGISYILTTDRKNSDGIWDETSDEADFHRSSDRKTVSISVSFRLVTIRRLHFNGISAIQTFSECNDSLLRNLQRWVRFYGLHQTCQDSRALGESLWRGATTSLDLSRGR